MLTLYTFAISHFSEKIRWVLRLAEVPFDERALTPGLHLPVTALIGRRGSSVPVIAGDGLRVQGSDAILQRLAMRGWLDDWLPDDDDAREDALAAAAAHEPLGRAVMRVGYGPLANQPEQVHRLWTLAAGPTETALLRTLMPLLLPGFRRRFGVGEASVAQAREQVETTLDALAIRRGQRPYLGARLGIEDLTVCALLAPLAGPPEHPVYGHPAFRDGAAASAKDWQQHPTLVWVRQIYARHRPPEPADAPLVRAAARLNG